MNLKGLYFFLSTGWGSVLSKLVLTALGVHEGRQGCENFNVGAYMDWCAENRGYVVDLFHGDTGWGSALSKLVLTAPSSF